VVDNSSKGAVYKGLAIATDAVPVTRLYATNFNAGAVVVFNSAWTPGSTAFTDPKLPRGYAPFNIVPIGSASPASAAKLVVTYAVQNGEKHDDVAGMSHGIVISILAVALTRFSASFSTASSIRKAGLEYPPNSHRRTNTPDRRPAGCVIHTQRPG
jgi:uncharacterized protein (TIGR03118 family)